jgi:hypothetical protein
MSSTATTERLKIEDLAVAENPNHDDPRVSLLKISQNSILTPFGHRPWGISYEHIYSGERTPKDQLEGMSRIHGLLINRSTGQFPVDEMLGMTETLRRRFSDDSNTDRAGLTRLQAKIQTKYADILETTLAERAIELSGVIAKSELYVAATGGEYKLSKKTIYIARITGLIALRQGLGMGLEPIVSDSEGNKGLLPDSMYMFNGLYVPVATEPQS